MVKRSFLRNQNVWFAHVNAARPPAFLSLDSINNVIEKPAPRWRPEGRELQRRLHTCTKTPGAQGSGKRTLTGTHVGEVHAYFCAPVLCSSPPRALLLAALLCAVPVALFLSSSLAPGASLPTLPLSPHSDSCCLSTFFLRVPLHHPHLGRHSQAWQTPPPELPSLAQNRHVEPTPLHSPSPPTWVWPKSSWTVNFCPGGLDSKWD